MKNETSFLLIFFLYIFTTTKNHLLFFYYYFPCKLCWMQHESVSVVLILLLLECFPGCCHLMRNQEIISHSLSVVGTRGDNSTKCCSFGEFCMNFPDAGKWSLTQIPQRMLNPNQVLSFFSHFSQF